MNSKSLRRVRRIRTRRLAHAEALELVTSILTRPVVNLENSRRLACWLSRRLGGQPAPEEAQLIEGSSCQTFPTDE